MSPNTDNKNPYFFDQDVVECLPPDTAAFDPTLANNAITPPIPLIPQQTDPAYTPHTPLVNADSETRRGVAASPKMANPDAVHAEAPEKKARPLTKLIAAVGAAVVTAGLANVAVPFLKNLGQEGAKSTLPDSPPATAAPAPPSSAPQTRETPVTVKLNPSTTSTTVHIKPAAPETPKAAAQEPEAKTAEFLPAAELKSIIETTGFHGLEGHQATVLKRVTINGKSVTILSLDGANASKHVSELKGDLQAAGNYAAAIPQFQSHLELDRPRDVTSQVSPDKYKAYVFFTGLPLTSLAGPQAAGLKGFTWSGEGEMNVGFINTSSTRETIATEAAQTMGRTQFVSGGSELSSDNQQELNEILHDMYGISVGFARYSALNGVPYDEYAQTAQATSLNASRYAGTDAHLFALTAAQYAAMKNS